MLSMTKWINDPTVSIIRHMRSNAKLPRLIGKRVQRRRKELGLTQEKLADMIGISRAYMGYIEQARNTPSLEVLQKIAKKLKISMANLIE